MNKITGILAAAGTAALLSVNPVLAQEETPTGVQSPESFALNEPQRLDLRERFDAMPRHEVGDVLPENYRTSPVPPDIASEVPNIEGYHYYTMPDGSVALVHAETREIVDIL